MATLLPHVSYYENFTKVDIKMTKFVMSADTACQPICSMFIYLIILHADINKHKDTLTLTHMIFIDTPLINMV